VSRRSEVAYLNGAPSTPGYLLALLRELSHVPRGLTEIAKAKQVQKTIQTDILYQFKKRFRKSILTFRTKDLFNFFFNRFSSTLNPLKTKLIRFWIRNLRYFLKYFDMALLCHISCKIKGSGPPIK